MDRLTRRRERYIREKQRSSLPAGAGIVAWRVALAAHARTFGWWLYRGGVINIASSSGLGSVDSSSSRCSRSRSRGGERGEWSWAHLVPDFYRAVVPDTIVQVPLPL